MYYLDRFYLYVHYIQIYIYVYVESQALSTRNRVDCMEEAEEMRAISWFQEPGRESVREPALKRSRECVRFVWWMMGCILSLARDGEGTANHSKSSMRLNVMPNNALSAMEPNTIHNWALDGVMPWRKTLRIEGRNENVYYTLYLFRTAGSQLQRVHFVSCGGIDLVNRPI